MRLDVLPTASATTTDSSGRLQLVNLEKVMPTWKVLVIRMCMPERWRQMRNDWAQRFMDTVQSEIYARAAADRGQVPPSSNEVEVALSERSLELAA